MKQRIITGAILLLFVASMFLLRETNLLLFDVFITLAIVFSTAEVSRVFIRSGKSNYMELAVIYAVSVYLMLIWGINASFPFASYLFSQLALLIVFSIIAFIIGLLNKKDYLENKKKQAGITPYEYSIKKVIRTLFVMVYPTLLLSFLYLINHIQDLRLPNIGVTAYAGVDLGFIVLIMTFLATIAADTFAYFIGSIVGGPKLAPLISPKKTVSGAIGGVVGSILTAVIIFLVLNSINNFNVAFFQAEVSIWHFVIYGFFASIISQAGDLFASMVKRRARAKDYSSIFPGHGGFMDRLDGVSFNAVFTFLYVILFFM